MNCDELTYRIAFASISGMGIDLAGKILDVIPSERDFFLMSENELRAVTGGKSKVYGRSYRNERLERALREQEFMSHTNVGVTYYTDSDFPARLLNAPDAPIMLYKCGDCDLNAQHVVSIVGTRKATVYGSHFCDSLVAELAQRVPGLVVVSGLAFGIDICAHRACLRNNVPTVAVQARGLNKIYPPRHRNDAIDIVRQGGIIVTDYQTQDPVLPFNFVARNRIIAALADCTVVAESAAKG
ncbi:MAG: DNA-processing protein DprA, partial [Bacteroidales bacterium]|nr:DNA-processing protein DprA [Bacteroidales bacterium]